ncbi:helix-turn-helix transcriptional regulator [Nocardia sp. NPDC050406]|uniref:helix-turn-helix transcriptional regulator n=1 Tax=Nocardia sp. NPDC050406 TaxID=3364318 RepID=UPI0037BB7281
MADVTYRMLELLAQLQTGRRFSGQELATRLGVSPRTLRRDVERLREYGYPVSTQPGPSGFYQLAAGRTLPPLVLDDDEAVATLVGLALLGATEARDTVRDNGFDTDPADESMSGRAERGDGIGSAADRAFGKIDQFLPKRLRPRVSALRETVETAPQTAPPINAEALATLGAAAARHEHLVFTYTSRDGTDSRRRVEPYREVHLRQRWYLLAWDVERTDWRVFRLDRMTEIATTATYFEPRALPARSAADFVREGMRTPRYRAVLTVAAPAAVLGDALKSLDCDIAPVDARRSRVTTLVDSFDWLVLRVGLLGVDFTIEEPAEFRERAVELADLLRRAATDTGGPGRYSVEHG